PARRPRHRLRRDRRRGRRGPARPGDRTDGTAHGAADLHRRPLDRRLRGARRAGQGRRPEGARRHAAAMSGGRRGAAATAQVLVMAKHPAPGAVKTRLAAQIGDAAACRLYDAFVRDLAARLATLEFPLTWAFWPPDAPFQTLVPGARCVPQAGGDL